MPGSLDRFLGPESHAKPRLDCCTPYRAAFPSGHSWAHSLYCQAGRRGQKLTEAERALLRRSGSWAPTLTPAQADVLEPVGEVALRCWLAHAPGCSCFGCRYTDAHLDDDDDMEAHDG